MGFLILIALIVIASVIAFFGGRIAHSENPTGAGRFVAGSAPIVGVILVLIVAVLFSTDTVENGHIGIKKQFGNLVGTTDSGLVTHSPLQSVAEVSVRQELRTYDMGQSNSAVSSDSQPVFLTVQVSYTLLRDGAVEVYKQTGGQYVERILDPAVYQDTKEVTAGYKAVEFAQNREKIRRQIEAKLQSDVGEIKSTESGANLKAIHINSIALRNVDFTPALKKAIEATVEANQNAKRAEAQVAIATAEAQSKVQTAKGDRDSAIARAEGEAQAQRLKQRTLTPELLTQQAIEKLNPNVQVIVCDSGKNCIPNAVLATANGGK